MYKLSRNKKKTYDRWNTVAYHPASNCMNEWQHRDFKAALMFYSASFNWMCQVSSVLLDGELLARLILVHKMN